MPNTFDLPVALLLLLALPAWWWWYLRHYDRQRLRIRMSYDPSLLHKPRWNPALLRLIVPALHTAALACLIVALARPQRVTLERTVADGIDIELVLDVSESMGTEDMGSENGMYNRLEAARMAAGQFIRGRLNDRIGIVLFAEEALAYAPLTFDYPFLEEQLNRIRFDMLPKNGTAMGNGIGLALNNLEAGKGKSRAIVLITDGVANRGKIDPVTAARLARIKHTRIYPIGVGQDEFMERTSAGARFAKSDLDEATLRQMATLTNGKYFRAKDGKALQNIFAEINNLEPSAEDAETYRTATDHYAGWVAAGIILLSLAWLAMLLPIGNPLEL